MRRQKEEFGPAAAAFTIEDVREALHERERLASTPDVGILVEERRAKKRGGVPSPKAVEESADSGPVRRKAASLLDILGFDPDGQEEAVPYNRSSVKREWLKNYDVLIDMRDKLEARLNVHRSDTLRRAGSGLSDHSALLGQHTADGAADHMDLERALTFVENERELLGEVTAAIGRVFRGTYGICEQTGKPIDGKRLEAIPFARFSLEGQQEREKTQQRMAAEQQTGNALFPTGDEDGELPLEKDDDGDE
ncbi:MAG: TraR/DksA C4-type zinc finger protein [Puniceicoccales bacterium]|jgi:RNA polymerase-binding transcription factor DksA|nr:TraR/DksA C4-type zinc finger protein [Puniceicoccales bacterium]